MLNVEKTGRNIKRLCDEKGITPNMIKDRLGLTNTGAVYKWFNGKSMPTLDNLLLLSELLDVSLDEILINE